MNILPKVGQPTAILLQAKDPTTNSDWVSLGNFSSYHEVTSWIIRKANPSVKSWFRMLTANVGETWTYFQR